LLHRPRPTCNASNKPPIRNVPRSYNELYWTDCSHVTGWQQPLVQPAVHRPAADGNRPSSCTWWPTLLSLGHKEAPIPCTSGTVSSTLASNGSACHINKSKACSLEGGSSLGSWTHADSCSTHSPTHPSNCWQLPSAQRSARCPGSQ
jgi:hypothetical protein